MVVVVFGEKIIILNVLNEIQTNVKKFPNVHKKTKTYFAQIELDKRKIFLLLNFHAHNKCSPAIVSGNINS